ncbi:hypothetical protein EPIR_1532 [Erwinia piriflorinigrans CFBP 5888]|uniref:Uncharacterized protein n=1 Tax=Erwinia piriflorinigrans CFBP 5888 TaxID=1161919 RepID=V5Z7H8_9GAMM|nr:hypothetical protein EPIR_1532 [Erwinia piriflorinigrans CFBP 5888]
MSWHWLVDTAPQRVFDALMMAAKQATEHSDSP